MPILRPLALLALLLAGSLPLAPQPSGTIIVDATEDRAADAAAGVDRPGSGLRLSTVCALDHPDLDAVIG